MKKILFLILFISGSLFAQDEEAKLAKPSYHKILIGISASPDISNEILPGSDNSTETNYKPQLGYTFGLKFNYNFSKKFGLITGVSSSTKRFRTDFEKPNYSGRGTVQTNPRYIKTNKYSHYFIDIPLKVVFRMGKGKTRFVGGLGIAANILLESRGKTTFFYGYGNEEETYEFLSSDNELHVSQVISIGIERSLKNKHLVRIEPNFKLQWYISPLTNSVVKIWTAGINFSYYFGLKKSLN